MIYKFVINFCFIPFRFLLKIISPVKALKILFEIDDLIYALEGKYAKKYGNGLHTKHKHIKYHDFFINNIQKGSQVLDLGCGNGALAYDIASSVDNCKVTGIEISAKNIKIAKQKYSHPAVDYIIGDVLTDLPDLKVDIIILSNVLEHLSDRIQVLNKLKTQYNPALILIRVPLFERDWRVPLRKELGIDYRLDKTHFIEYTNNEFFTEIKNAGLTIKEYAIKWGEIWAVTA